MFNSISILIAEYNPVDADLLLRALRNSGFEPEWKVVDTEKDFINSLHAGLDLIFCDYLMPQFNALRALELLKESKLDLPFIIVSGTIGEETAVAAMKLGASDYLLKDRLVRIGESVKHALAENLLRQNQKQSDIRLNYLAHYDPLTNLPNRTLFYDTLSKTLTQAAEKNWQVAVLFMDLDHFKRVNDTLGHGFGDELLVQFSERLLKCIRLRDTVGRLGGDEFALILPMQQGQNNAIIVANKIRDALIPPFVLNGHEIIVTASIGITLYPYDATDCETLIKYADTAMYRAKETGRNAYCFFTPKMNAEVLARLEMETALRQAIEKEEFVLYYQPKVRLKDGYISSLEALLRWQRPGHGLVSPSDFIPVLEETGLIMHVGNWVIDEACKQIRIWMNSPIGEIQVSVNVSGRQFIEGDLEKYVSQSIKNNHIPANLLELELTESSLMINVEHTLKSMENLKNMGVKISIDDFGTGYSSLSYLRRFPIDKLKIDVAFIRYITTNPDDAAIALTIIRMAHSLKLEVVAEGVETVEQVKFLRRKHCDQIQGYYYCRPLPPFELKQILIAKKFYH